MKKLIVSLFALTFMLGIGNRVFAAPGDGDGSEPIYPVPPVIIDPRAMSVDLE